MAGQVVLITGGGGGIGSALARRLVDQGDAVVLFGRRAEPLERLAGELGERSLAVPGDARRLDDLERAVRLGQEGFGRLDGLAHCVGSIRLRPLAPDDPRGVRRDGRDQPDHGVPGLPGRAVGRCGPRTRGRSSWSARSRSARG